MKKIIARLCFLAILITSISVFSQPMTKGEFKQYFTQGSLMMLDNFYDTAVRTFLHIHKADPSNANVNYKIGICYLHLPSDKLKSISYLENATKQTKGNYIEDDPNEKNAPEDALYYLGQAYHYSYRFDEAIEQFNKFREIVGKWNLNLVKEIDHWIEVSKNAKTLTEKPVDCSISNLGDSINCEFADYSPVISADESMLCFTSRREGTGGPDNKTIDDDFFEDIFVSYRGPYGTWRKAKGLSKTINTDGNEATIGLSADGQQLYVYRDDAGDGNIYISKLDGDYWNAPYKMDASNVNSTSWEPSACISADGNTMYFVSDRPGGLGGSDIYQCNRLPNRAWSEPKNLGTPINSPYNEDAPFIHPDGVTFFFSSKGHNSMGGYDVFYSTKVAENVWASPINMGYPINTTDDDIYFVTSSDGRRAYYASFRPEGKGEKDIYMVSMPIPIVKSVAILVGWLKNRDGSPIPKYSSVTIKSSKGESNSCKPNEASGKFVHSLFPGQEYEITIETNGNKIFNDKFFLPEDSSYQSLGRGFFQRIIYIGDTTHYFSMNKVKDTVSKIQMAPMAGKILLSEKPDDVGANITLQLLNSQGNVIASAVTDSKGNFSFQNIPSGQKYIVKIDENDPILKTHQQFYLANSAGKIITPSMKEERFFLFKNISPDMNTVSQLDVKDSLSVSMPSMKGKMLKSENTNDGIGNLYVSISDSKGIIIEKTKTDDSGMFTFEKLSADKNYTVKLNENDPLLSGLKKVYLANEAGKVVKVLSMNNKGERGMFKNLPADLMQLAEVKETFVTTFNKDTVTAIVHKNVKYTGDEKFDFAVYFPYNKKEIDISIGSFLSLMEKVEKSISNNGTATISIVASSSNVPTKTFTSNEALSEMRANEVKDKVRASMSLKNLDAAKISYDISTKVQGPEYKNDAVQNRKEYEKWQFVKVIVK